MSDILNLIDNALEDYSLSGDAMRWTPEAPEMPGSEFASGSYYAVIDETHAFANAWLESLMSRMREVADAVAPALATVADEVRTAAVQTRVPWMVGQDEPSITRDDIRWKTPLSLPPFELAVRMPEPPPHPGIVTALPSPQPAGDILENIYRAYRSVSTAKGRRVQPADRQGPPPHLTHALPVPEEMAEEAMSTMQRRHITAREAQECLGIPASTIRGWAKDEARLSAVSIAANGERWYRLADVLELAATTRRRRPHCRPNRRRRDITRSRQDDACPETGQAA